MLLCVERRDECGGFDVKRRRVPVIQTRMSNGGLRRFCIRHAAFAKPDFLLDFALMIFKSLQCVDFSACDVRKQFFGFIEAAGLMRGFRLIAQRGKAGRQVAGKRKSVNLFTGAFPVACDLEQDGCELLRRNLAPDHGFQKPRNKTNGAAVLRLDFLQFPNKRLPLDSAHR